VCFKQDRLMLVDQDGFKQPVTVSQASVLNSDCVLGHSINRHVPSAHTLVKMRLPLVPPKPKELLMTAVMVISRAAWGT